MLTVPRFLSRKAARHAVFALTALLLFALPWVDFASAVGQGGWAALSGGVLAVVGAVLVFTTVRSPGAGLTDLLVALVVAYCLTNGALASPGLAGRAVTLALAYAVGRGLRGANRSLAYALVLTGAVQAAMGLGQWLGLLPLRNVLFPATGCFDNPGPWGGYVALASAGTVGLWLWAPPQRRWARTGLGVASAVLAAGLVLSDSRAAWSGLLVSGTVAAAVRWHIGWRRWLPAVVVGGGVALAALSAYRPASAAPRLLIWKSSLHLWAEHPWTGVGTRQFPAHYLTAQADYLTTADSEERRQAADTQTAYDEPLRWLCEQGVAGTALLVAAVVCGVTAVTRHRSHGARLTLPPVVALAVFSLFSYPSDVWALWVWLPLLAGASLPAGKVLRARGWMRPAIAVLLMSFSVWGFCRFAVLVRLDRALTTWWTTDSPQAHRYVRTHLRTLRDDPAALDYYSRLLLFRGDHAAALPEMERLGRMRPSVGLLVETGRAYSAAERPKEAYACFDKAACMTPGLLTPLYARWQLLRTEEREAEARRTARQIVAFQPKIDNLTTRAMQREAEDYLTHTNDTNR